MGKFAEALKAKLATLGKAKVGSLQDFVKDPQKELEQIYLENDEFFVRKAVSKMMEATLGKLPPEKQQEINAKNLPEEEMWAAVAEAWEAQAGEEAAALAAREMEGIVSPSDPRYPREKLLVNQFQADIDALRAEIKPEDPEAQAKRELLDKVEQDLSETSEEALEHFDRLDRNLMPRMDTVQYSATTDFIVGHENGKYAEKIAHNVSPRMGVMHYITDQVAPENGSFSSQDSADLAGLSPELDPGLKQDVLGLLNQMDAHKKEYRIEEGTLIKSKTPHSNNQYFSAEQGTKAYAFWPLRSAFEKLSNALQAKDFGKLREAEQHYSDMRAFTDGMMQTMGKYKTPLCGGNVNSTRTANFRTTVPPEHLKDFVTHSKLNGLYLLHGLSQNSGVPVQKILEDPVSAMRAGAKKFIEKESLHTLPNTGAKLINALSPEFGRLMQQNYVTTDPGLCGRGFDALACMEKDPEKRKRIYGVGSLAQAAGTIVVREHTDKLVAISEMDAARKDCLYQHAALLPEEDFNPVAVADVLMKEDWKKQADPRRLVQQLRAQGKLDYDVLAEKFDKICEDAEEALDGVNSVTFSSFDRKHFYQATRKAYGELIRTATPEEKQDPGFQKFRDKVFGMQLRFGWNGSKEAAAEVKESCRKLDDAITLQRQKKTGWFISSKNTDEHNRMVIAQRKLQYKLKQLRGEDISDLPADEIEALKKVDLKKLVDKARSETYRYCCLKTKNGTDKSFVHGVGSERYNKAYESLDAIDDIAETCGLMSPGEKLLHASRRQIMNIRNDKEWTRQQAENAAARAIIGMSLAHGNKSFEEQKKYLDTEKLNQTVEQVKNDPAFRRMMENEGVLNIADKIIAGNSSLTDSFIRAKDQLAMEAEQADNDARKTGIHELGEADNVEVMTAEDKKKMWGDNPIQL